jgi:hypothetical protein
VSDGEFEMKRRRRSTAAIPSNSGANNKPLVNKFVVYDSDSDYDPCDDTEWDL